MKNKYEKNIIEAKLFTTYLVVIVLLYVLKMVVNY